MTDILSDPLWDDYRERLRRMAFVRFGRDPYLPAKVRSSARFAMLYREARSPDTADLQLIENASHIAGIAIERHINEVALRLERDRLRLLLEITNSMTSKLDLPPSVRSTVRRTCCASRDVTFARCFFPMPTAGSCG